uniref:Uncharacterized protein n=1 Tax=Monopterus albus TaxID=43700 RepID=A0A3Q3KG48_MONAL
LKGKKGQCICPPLPRELFLVTQQVYPELQDKEKLSHTKIQQKLLRKLGDDAFPFFEMRHINCLTVLKIQDKSGSSPAPTGQIPFEVKAFCSENQDDRIDKLSSVCLSICKVHFSCPQLEASSALNTACDMCLCVCLQMFYHGKLVRASVEITNSSSRNSKDISTSGDLICVVSASHDTVKEYTLHPLLAHNREWRGLALDRQLKHEDTNLASSRRWDPGTLHYTNCPQCACYPVCQITSGVLHCMSYSEVSLEVPFRPMHPKPEPVTVHPAHSNMETSIFVRNSDMPHGSQSLWRCSTLRAKCFLRMIRLYEMFKI